MSDPTPHDIAAAFAPIGNKVGSKPKAPAEVWEPLIPAPEEPPVLEKMRHPKFGRASFQWIYRDADGNPLCAVARFDHTDKEGRPAKDFFPYVYGRRAWTTTGGNRLDRTDWHMKGLPEPRPLYGLDRLAARPDAPVLLVEGEKKTHAAERLFAEVVAVSAMNGAKAPIKADWSALAGAMSRSGPIATSRALGLPGRPRTCCRRPVLHPCGWLMCRSGFGRRNGIWPRLNCRTE